jgi:hypothetical protein
MKRGHWFLVAALLLSGCALKNHTHPVVTEREPSLMVLDLASTRTDSVVVPVTEGTYRIGVINLAPARSYEIGLAVANETIAPLELPKVVEEPAQEPSVEALAGTCGGIPQAIGTLARTTEESDVPIAVAALSAQVNACDPKTTADSTLKLRGRRAIGATMWESEVTIREGQTVTLRVVRSDDEARRWARGYRTGSRGQWRSTYGFNFIANTFASDRRYWLQELDEAVQTPEGKYVIRSRRSGEYFNFVPSIFYTWMPADRELTDWSRSWTAGLGFDFQAPVVSVGYSATYNQNATVSVGLSLHQVTRLHEQYSVGQRLNELVGESALERNVYRANPYVAVTIRSLSNPFDRPAGNSP